MPDRLARSQPSTGVTRNRRAVWWAVACLVFVAGEAALRLYWIVGGRWGYTACDRTDLGDPAGGCGADQVDVLPFWSGWGALGVAVLLGMVAVCALRFPGRWTAAGGWAAAGLLLLVAFPLHLLFELPAALAGRPSDWRDLGARLALVAGGVLFCGLANGSGPPRGPVTAGYRPVPRWTRRWAYVAVALPVVGWAVPHGLWVLGIPFGISDHEMDGIHRGLSTPTGVAITVVPPLAGLLVLGLVQRWGQRFPGWVPGLRGRPVPRLLAVVPAGLVASALVTYGALSFTLFVGELLDGDLRWSEVREGWATTATLAVFLGWGVALAVTTSGYLLATRPGRDQAAEASLRQPLPADPPDRPSSRDASSEERRIPPDATPTSPAPPGRLRAAWSAAHAPVAGVPRWARVAAYLIPFTVLPSALWRIAVVVFDIPLDGGQTDAGRGDVPSWLPMEVYVVVLSLFSELLAFTAIGLITRWGEVFPRWIPGLGGRRVPALAAVVPAGLGAATLTVLWTGSILAVAAGRSVQGGRLPAGHLLTTYDWHFAALITSYAPLLLWGPLLGAVTVAYWQRRRRAVTTVR